MPVMSRGYGPFYTNTTPVNGTDEVQTLTISAAATSTFKLRYDGFTTTTITWTSDNTTLIAAIDAALEALPSIGTGGVATAAGSITSGVGTLTITFSGANLAKSAVSTITVPTASLTGASATVSIAKTTTGVAAAFRGARPGATAIDTTAGKLYIQTNTAGGSAVTWTVVGSQS